MNDSKIKGFFERFTSWAIAGLGFSLMIITISAVYATFNYTVSVNTVSTGSGLSATEWNKMIANFGTIDAQLTTLSSGSIPTWVVVAYNGTSCPTGWTEASGSSVPTGIGGSTTLNLRGEFIRGLDNGRWVDAGRVFWSAQLGMVESHVHAGGSRTSSFQNGAGAYNGGQVGVNTSAFGWTETRPRNVALLYCVKN